jgi:hypothetical protein
MQAKRDEDEENLDPNLDHLSLNLEITPANANLSCLKRNVRAT